MKIVLKHIWVPTVTLLLFALYWLIFIDPFIPTASGGLGHDYRGNLSEMLIGFVHYHSNDALHIPWFTPATCAGNMFVAGVANPYFNVQQWLTFYLDPLLAAQLVFMGFAMIGYNGMYLLLRGPFETDRIGALLGATIMLFNGFFAYRMIIGHVAFHSFMLTPLLAYCLIRSERAPVHQTLIATLLLTYTIMTASVYTLVPAAMITVGILLIYQLRFENLQW